MIFDANDNGFDDGEYYKFDTSLLNLMIADIVALFETTVWRLELKTFNQDKNYRWHAVTCADMKRERTTNDRDYKIKLSDELRDKEGAAM